MLRISDPKDKRSQGQRVQKEMRRAAARRELTCMSCMIRMIWRSAVSILEQASVFTLGSPVIARHQESQGYHDISSQYVTLSTTFIFD